jgi:hypothetical protein
MIALGEITVPADRMGQLRPGVVDDLVGSIKTEVTAADHRSA